MEFVGALENLVQKLLKVEQTSLRSFQEKKKNFSTEHQSQVIHCRPTVSVGLVHVYTVM